MSRLRTWRMLLALFAALTLVAAACGDSDDDGGDDTEETADDATSESTAPPDDDSGADPDADTGDGAFRAAFVSPSAINDLAFSQTIFDAMEALQADYGADSFEFEFSDGLFVVEDAAAALRGYAEDGFDLVIAHGSQYGGSLQEIAPDFPDTAFAWGPAADDFGLANVSSYNSAADEGGYVMGVLAAQLSASGNIGVVGPVEAGEPTDFINAFLRGVGDDAEATVVYTGSFSDVALASEAANSFISNGADVLTGTSQAMVGAIGVAQQNDVLWFATQSDQRTLAPEHVVVSQVYEWEVILKPMIDGIIGGTLGGFSDEINLENGGIVMAFNDGVVIDDPAAAAAVVDETVAGIIAGEIETEG